jgi:hypothetical protein
MITKKCDVEMRNKGKLSPDKKRRNDEEGKRIN